MKKAGLKNEELVSSLQISGSSAILSRNNYGVHLFTEENLKDGVIGARLSIPGYNLRELQQSIDTNITELLPITQPELEDMVPLEVHQSVLNELSGSLHTKMQLREKIDQLKADLLTKETTIGELEISLDDALLQKSIADNTIDTKAEQIALVIKDLNYAIQKATNEAIGRASLQARNEILITENESLKEQLFGRQAQIEAGAISSGTIFTVNPLLQTNPDERPIFARQKYVRTITGRHSSNRDPDIINGAELSIFNATDEQIIVNIRRKDTDANWIAIEGFSIGNPGGANVSVAAGGVRTIRLVGIKDWSTGARDREYESSLIFESGGESVTIPTEIKRRR